MSTTVTATTDRIRLVGLSARGHHGVLPFEREEGQLFTVDVTLDVGQRGTAVVAVTDSLDDTVDYAAVATAVVTIIEGEPVNLLETLAGRIADKVLGFPRVVAAEVTVHKPQAPLDVAFEDVSVSIYRVSDDAAGQTGIQPVTQAAWAASGAAPAGQGYPEEAVQPVPVPGAHSAAPAGPAGGAGPAAVPGSARSAGSGDASGSEEPVGPLTWTRSVSVSDAAAGVAASPGAAGPGGPLDAPPTAGSPGGAHAAGTADPWAPDPWIRDTADDRGPEPVGSSGPDGLSGSTGAASLVGTASPAEDVLEGSLGGVGSAPPRESLEASAASALMGSSPAGAGEGRHAAPAEPAPDSQPDYQASYQGDRPWEPAASSLPSSASSPAPSAEGGPGDLLSASPYVASSPAVPADTGGPGHLPGAQEGGQEVPAAPDQTQVQPVGLPLGASAPQAPAAEPADPLGERPGRPVGVVFALGANVGHLLTTLRQAVHALKSTEGIEVVQVAPLARSVAMVPEGDEPQPDFLNTVVTGLTTLSARELLSVCQQLERDAGRVRTGHWGPRSLDVDLVMLEGVTSDDPGLALPHPRARERAFVLVPWSQADPFAELGGQTVAELAEQAPDRSGLRWLAFDWLDTDNIPDKPTGPYVAPPVADNVPDPTGVVYDAAQVEALAAGPDAAADRYEAPGGAGSAAAAPQDASWSSQSSQPSQSDPRAGGMFGAQAPLAGDAGEPVEPPVPQEYVVLGDQEPSGGPEGAVEGARGRTAPRGGLPQGVVGAGAADSWDSPPGWNDVIGGAAGADPDTGPRQGA